MSIIQAYKLSCFSPLPTNNLVNYPDLDVESSESFYPFKSIQNAVILKPLNCIFVDIRLYPHDRYVELSLLVRTGTNIGI